MKYYLFFHIGANRKEIGINPQSTEGYFGDIQKDIIPIEGRIDFDFELPIPKLDKKANPTTMLSVVMIPPWFIIVKKHFIEFLKEFNIGCFQQWPIDVNFEGSKLKDYCLFYLPMTKQAEYIDFNQSQFYIGKYSDYQYVGDKMVINDYNNYINIKEVLEGEMDKCLKHRRIVIDLRDANEDMFRIINAPAGGYYVSDRLKKAIEKNGFTGMTFKEVSEADKRIKVIY